ncbi:MAG: oxidoreductase [Clostridiales bacterium]|nr:oxidoreductase [Clostridiales bacterium]
MARYGLVCDIEKCCGCFACFLSCRDEFSGKEHAPTAASQEVGQVWLKIEEVEYGEGTKIKVDYIPKMCQHCADPACAKGAPEGAVYKRDDGIVIFDPEKAKGAKGIADNCPYGVVSWNEERSIPQKCTLCAHMIDEGEKTVRCAECCPTGALVFGDLDDPGSEASRILAGKEATVEIWKPEAGTGPGCRYIRLPRPFIAGEVFFSDNPSEPAKGIPVTLTDSSGSARGCVTDCFGDFVFERLEEGRAYTLCIEAEGYQRTELAADPSASMNVGAIALPPL